MPLARLTEPTGEPAVWIQWRWMGDSICDDTSEISAGFWLDFLSYSSSVPLSSVPSLSLSQLHGGSESSSEGGWFPDEEGARLLRHGAGETTEALPGHPRRVRTVHFTIHQVWTSTSKQTWVKTMPGTAFAGKCSFRRQNILQSRKVEFK